MATPLPTRSAQEQLRRDERAAILRRRRRAGFGNAKARQLPTVGLALSGGGVRSATFGLGLLRGLAAQGLLARVDYLSTISGGGYVGAMLGRLVDTLGLGPAQQLLAAGSSPVLDWLRSNGRYLAPAGSRDVGILIVSYLRAFLAVHIEAFFALMPVALLLTLPHLLQHSLGWLDAKAWEGWASPWFALTLLWAAALLPSLLVAYWAAPETRSPELGERRLYPADIFLLAALTALALLLTLRPGDPPLLQSWRQADPAMPLLVLALWSAALGHGGAMVHLALAREARPLTVARLRNRLTYGLRGALLGSLLLAGAGVLDWASWALLLMLSSAQPPDWVWGGLGLGGVLLLALRALAPVLQQLAAQAQARRTLALGPQILNIAGHLGAVMLLLAWLLAVQWWVFAQEPLAAVRAFPAWMRWSLLALAALVWWLTTARLPQAANASSLSGFYQARLVRAWLAAGNRRRGLCTPFTPADQRLRSVTEVAAGDDIDLPRHRPEDQGGPLHLIGACLNQTRDDASGLFNADRKGQLAIASARALEVGPQEVVRWAQDEAHGDTARTAGTLGRWIAISGGAAAPGAGAYTSRGWALVMFLLGIRLGHWIAAPLPQALPRLKDWLWQRAPKPLMLWSEARATFFGQARPWWYLSDGGHFDNTGVYALIKRECDFIILSDASADPDYRFADIENLVRKARIDLDAEIEFYARQEAARLLSLAGDGLTVLSPDELADNSTRRGVLLARIRYCRSDPARGEREGTLLVVKPNLHVCLDLDLLAYAQRHPSFPHESTGDQFFDEAQWESYQRLGQDTGQALYDRWLGQLPGWDRVQLHKLAQPERLHQPSLALAAQPAAGAQPSVPRWRRGVGAAAIGTSVGVGLTGTLLLSLWQVQEQLNRAADSRQAEIRQLLTDSSKELLDAAGECARVGAQTLGHVEQLREFSKDHSLSAAEQTTVTRLLDRLQTQCTRTPPPYAACSGPERKHQEDLCEVALKDLSDSSALNYWHPASPERGAQLSEVWARMRGQLSLAWALLGGDARHARVAMAPPPPDQGITPAPAPSSAAASALATAESSYAPNAIAAIEPAESAQLRARCPTGTRLYTQIYNEAARWRAEQLRQRLQEAPAVPLRIAPIENVTRSAAMRQQRPPVPWQQPTFIVHDAELRPCAQVLAQLVQQRWSPASGDKPWISTLPPGLKSQTLTIELWLPTPPISRTGMR
ncbi:MAG: hypothetical protein KGM60_04360 [Comamonadaceae bacterium]|nr:hypothetical protein [Comamonadaceae bacterium]